MALNTGLERARSAVRSPKTAVCRDAPTGVATCTRHSSGRKLILPSQPRAARVAHLPESSRTRRSPQRTFPPFRLRIFLLSPISVSRPFPRPPPFNIDGIFTGSPRRRLEAPRTTRGPRDIPGISRTHWQWYRNGKGLTLSTSRSPRAHSHFLDIKSAPVRSHSVRTCAGCLSYMPKVHAHVRTLFGLIARGTRLCGTTTVRGAHAHNQNAHAQRVLGGKVGEARPRHADQRAREVRAVRTDIYIFFSLLVLTGLHGEADGEIGVGGRM